MEPSPLVMNTPHLPLAVFDFVYRSEAELRLPRYAGSAWRGAFGRALKRTVCVVRGTPCPDCLLYRSCIYPYVFETPPPPDSAKMRRYPAAPHPFVLRIDPRQTGPDYRLGVILFGRADRSLPYFIHALEQAGRAGIGGHRQALELVAVDQAIPSGSEGWQTVHARNQPLRMAPATTVTVPDPPAELVIELLTPLRLQHKGHLVTPATLRFADLFGALLRRISMLSYFHTDTPLEVDFAALARSAATVGLLEPKLRWYDWTRYSSRQDTTLAMGGLLGQFRLRGAELEPFWPYLWLGQWTHAGKGATMGLGQYSIRPASLPEHP